MGVTGKTNELGIANNILAGFLVSVVALSPIPFGSNRPIFWALFTAILALAALAYLTFSLSRGLPLRNRLKRLFWPISLYVSLLLYLCFQLVVLGNVQFIMPGDYQLLHDRFTLASGQTTLMLMRQLGYGLMFFLMLQVCVNRDRASWMLKAVFVIGVLHALIGLVFLYVLNDTVLFHEKQSSIGAATGTFLNRNNYSTFLSITAIAGLFVIFGMAARMRRERHSRYPAYDLTKIFGSIGVCVCLLLIVVTALLTKSRAGNFSMFVGILCFGLLVALKSSNSLAKKLAVAVAAISVVLFVTGIYGGGLLDRLLSSEHGLEKRSELYAQVWEMILSRPFTGFGGGSFEWVYPLFHRPPVSPDLVWDKAHSTYLTLWVELGLIAGSIPIAIFVIFSFDLLKNLSYQSIAALSALAVVATHSVFDFSMEIYASTIVFISVFSAGCTNKHNL